MATALMLGPRGAKRSQPFFVSATICLRRSIEQGAGQIFLSAQAVSVPEVWEERFGDDAVPLFCKPIQFWSALLSDYKVAPV